MEEKTAVHDKPLVKIKILQRKAKQIQNNSSEANSGKQPGSAGQTEEKRTPLDEEKKFDGMCLF